MKSVARELPKYGLEYVRAHEVGWHDGDSEHVDEFTFLFRKGNENQQLGKGVFVGEGIALTITEVEYVSDKLLCMVLRYSLV